MKKILFITVAACLLLVACRPEGENENSTTIEEDKINIRASFDRVEKLAQNFRNGNFYHFTEDFFGIGPREEYDYIYVGKGYGDYVYPYYINTPEEGDFNRYEGCTYPEYDGYCYEWVNDGNGDYTIVYDYKYVGEGKGMYKLGDPYTEYDMVMPEFTQLLGEKLENVVNVDQFERDGHFKMSTFAGKYTWNNTTKQWDKTSKNDIQVLFPSVESSNANCELAITEYTDVSCSIEGSTTWLPTKISSSFHKDGVKIAGVDATGSYNSYGIPKNVSVNVYSKPITLQTTLSQMSSSKFSASLSINDETNSENSLSISGEATLSNSVDNYTDLSDCEINNLKLTLKQFKLSITGTIDLKTLNNLDYESVADINSCINFTVFYDGQKTGTLKVEEIGRDRYLYIVYKDGTKENTELYYDSFLTDIQHIFMTKR